MFFLKKPSLVDQVVICPGSVWERKACVRGHTAFLWRYDLGLSSGVLW